MLIDTSVFALLSFGNGGYGREFAAAFAQTVAVAAGSFAVGTLAGFAGSGAKLSRHAPLRVLGRSYTTVVRALPELLCLLIAFYALAPALESALHAAHLVSPAFAFDPLAVAICSLGFIQGAYLTDIFRGALIAVPAGQVEAALAFGMTRAQVFRRVRLPLALRLALPGVSNVWLNATKDASYISVLGSFSDLLKTSQLAAGATRHYLFFHLVTAALFLALSIGSMAVFGTLQKRVNRGVRLASL
ncbi:ABC transporter permease subunit [Paraburkholderia sp. Ac-20340]|uniref:ABC transporter permease subunit n=1 Tax=Paraburkholderia sp. Ac-20340 TaxID=2703888 RepID=UPI00197FE0D6|nr:ABC transporter permease subunit [Paraburkholderia sp. Ac-20340]